MEKIYSLLSWNVENFKKNNSSNTTQRIKRIVKTIKAENPDVFAIYEVIGKDIFEAMTKEFPGYNFHITEGDQVQEILVGVRGGISAFFTQKTSLKAGVDILRPGALLTLTINEVQYPILFLHLKSADDARSFGLRDHMLSRAIKFMGTLSKDKTANYLFIGDLNTMGLNYYFDRDISPEQELDKADIYAGRYYNLERLQKTVEFTYNNGSKSKYPKSNLDHCYAAKHMQFKMFNNKNGSQGISPVDVRGWNDKNTVAEQDKWIEDYSDHAYLYLEVHG